MLAHATPRVPLCELPPKPKNADTTPAFVTAPSQPKDLKLPSWELATAPTVGRGALPATAFGTRLEFGRRFNSLRLRIGGSYEASWLNETGGRGGAFSLLSGRFALDYSLAWQRSHFGSGVVFEPGLLSAQGSDVDHPKRVREFWLAPALFVEWTVGVAGGSEFGVTAETFVPLGRPEFQLDDFTVFRPSTVGGRAALLFRLGIL